MKKILVISVLARICAVPTLLPQGKKDAEDLTDQ
jgi:hypothetical protein